MYKVTNTSFDEIFSKYKITNLSQLSSELLIEVAEKLRVEPAWNLDKKTKRRLSIDEISTMKKIELQYSYSTYMGDSYWESRHVEKDKKFKILEKMQGHMEGKETFELMESVGMGLNNIKPRETRDIDVSYQWIKELAKSPMGKNLKIENELGERITGDGVEKKEELNTKPEELIAEKAPVTPPLDLHALPITNLRKMAKAEGFNSFGISKTKLINELAKKYEVKGVPLS